MWKRLRYRLDLFYLWLEWHHVKRPLDPYLNPIKLPEAIRIIIHERDAGLFPVEIELRITEYPSSVTNGNYSARISAEGLVRVYYTDQLLKSFYSKQV